MGRQVGGQLGEWVGERVGGGWRQVVVGIASMPIHVLYIYTYTHAYVCVCPCICGYVLFPGVFCFSVCVCPSVCCASCCWLCIAGMCKCSA